MFSMKSPVPLVRQGRQTKLIVETVFFGFFFACVDGDRSSGRTIFSVITSPP